MSTERHVSNTLGYMRGYFRLKRENEELRTRIKLLEEVVE